MAGETVFKKVQAEKWIREVEELNRKTDELLKKVTACLQEIKSESEGPFVDAFYEVASKLTPKFAELMKSLGNLITALQDVILKFKEFAEAAVDGIRGAAQSMVGGISIS